MPSPILSSLDTAHTFTHRLSSHTIANTDRNEYSIEYKRRNAEDEGKGEGKNSVAGRADQLGVASWL